MVILFSDWNIGNLIFWSEYWSNQLQNSDQITEILENYRNSSTNIPIRKFDDQGILMKFQKITEKVWTYLKYLRARIVRKPFRACFSKSRELVTVCRFVLYYIASFEHNLVLFSCQPPACLQPVDPQRSQLSLLTQCASARVQDGSNNAADCRLGEFTLFCTI